MNSRQKVSSSAVFPLPDWTGRAHMIFGPRKSGTSLLESLIDSAPGTLVWPGEFKISRLALMRYSDRQKLTEGYKGLLDKNRELKLAPEAALNQLSSGQVQTLKDLIRCDILSVYQTLGERVGPEPHQWVFKEAGGEPEKVFLLFKSMFPDGKIIVIVRDPFEIVRSLINRRQATGRPFKIRFEVWDVLRIYKQLLSFCGRPDVHFVFYDELTGDELIPSMKAVAAHLGVPFSDSITHTTEFGRPTVVRTSTRDVTEVFKNHRKWTKGLSFSRVQAIRVYYSAIMALRKFNAIEAASYEQLIATIERHRAIVGDPRSRETQ